MFPKTRNLYSKALVKIVSDQYQRRRHRNTADSKTPWRTLGLARWDANFCKEKDKGSQSFAATEMVNDDKWKRLRTESNAI